jgi:hypothetical protein
MTAKSFAQHCDGLIGTWSGERNGNELKNEKVRSAWEWAIGKAFLQEHWFTSGGEGVLGLEAIAFFRIVNQLPGEFFAAYRSRGIGCGTSSFRDGQWVLTHQWFQAGGKAQIRLTFLDADTYGQEVDEITDKGELRFLSKAILRRE